MPSAHSDGFTWQDNSQGSTGGPNVKWCSSSISQVLDFYDMWNAMICFTTQRWTLDCILQLYWLILRTAANITCAIIWQLGPRHGTEPTKQPFGFDTTSHFPVTVAQRAAKELAKAEQVVNEGKRKKRERVASGPSVWSSLRACSPLVSPSVLKCYKCISAVGHAFAWLTSDPPTAPLAAPGEESELMLRG